MTELTNALAARAVAREELTAEEAVLARATAYLAERDAAHHRLAAGDQAAVQRQARRAEEHFRENRGGSPAPLVITDKRLAEQMVEGQTRAAALATVERLQASVRAKRIKLTAVESAVRAAALAILATEADAIAQQIIDRDAETEAMRQRLVGLRDLVPPSALVRKAAWLPSDWINTPISELAALEGAGGRHPARQHTPLNRLDRDEIAPAAIQHWRARLEALLSSAAAVGEPTSADRAA